ncbi:transglycosylase family protein [Calidifontibacter terrae]
MTTLAATGAVAAMSAAVGAAQPAHADTSVWDRVAACESGGNWSINTGNGFYGGLQFTLQTWHGYGGQGMPNQASRAEQIRVAQRVLASQGPGAWPVCSVRAGLTRANGGASGGTTAPAPTQDRPSRSTTRTTVPKKTYVAPKAEKKTYVAPKAEKKTYVAPKAAKKAHTHTKRAQATQKDFGAKSSKVAVASTYRVKSGDTLSKLAEKFGLSNWNTLFHANSTKISNPNLIFVGQVLNIPVK